MNSYSIFFLKSLYPDFNEDADQASILNWKNAGREPGSDYGALRKIVLQLKATGLRGKPVERELGKAYVECEEDGVIKNLTQSQWLELCYFASH